MRGHLIKGGERKGRKRRFTGSFYSPQKSATRALLRRTKPPQPIHKKGRKMREAFAAAAGGGEFSLGPKPWLEHRQGRSAPRRWRNRPFERQLFMWDPRFVRVFSSFSSSLQKAQPPLRVSPNPPKWFVYLGQHGDPPQSGLSGFPFPPPSLSKRAESGGAGRALCSCDPGVGPERRFP